MPDASEVLRRYSCFRPKVSPADLLSGDINKREGKIILAGKKEDDLGGSIRRHIMSDINRYFWEHPRDVDDTRLVFSATEVGGRYSEGKDGSARLVLKIRVGLATSPPEGGGN